MNNIAMRNLFPSSGAVSADTPSRQDRLAALRREIDVGEGYRSPVENHGLAFGVPQIDAHLPRGLEMQGLHDIAPTDYRAMPAAMGFLLATTVCFLRQRKGLVLWPLLKTTDTLFGAPYAPGLARMGLDPGRVLIVRCRTRQEILWVMEEGAKLGGLAAILGTRPERMDLTASRRLKLAAAPSHTPILLLRTTQDTNPSAALTRWRIAPALTAQNEIAPSAITRWSVVLEEARGGRSGHWIMEWDHVALRFRLAADVSDRAAPQARRRIA